MKITQIRNATLMIEFESSRHGQIGVLVDPMLASRGALPALKYFGGARRRNPLVDLPTNAEALLARVTHGLVTHCRRGHFDHLDRAGKRFLRERETPVFCMEVDALYLRSRGLVPQALQPGVKQPFLDGHVTTVPCVHGEGLVGRLMAHGHGYLIELPGEPSVYVAGDTLLTPEVRHCLSVLQPDIAVLPAGGARFDLGGEILMDGQDVLDACRLTPGIVWANHLEALDHCPVTREELLGAARRAGLGERLMVPADGATLTFERGPSGVSWACSAAGAS